VTKTLDNKSDKSNLWFVMRDLKRNNANVPAYKMLSGKGFKVFTPMKWYLVKKFGHNIREMAPVIQDLLIVYSSRTKLDPIVNNTHTLQYRFFKGGGYQKPMTVRDEDMNRFIDAVKSADSTTFYEPEEITPNMIGRMIRIVGGSLDGYEVPLLKMRGSKKKRIIVELPMILVASVEIEPEFIQLL
jgi:hypothetical protein